jgi:hypothetical protein
MSVTDALRISEAGVATGLSPHTLRYYERAGLMLDPVGRADSTHRRYSEAEVGSGTEGERLALLEEHRDAVRAQFDEVARNLAAIESKVTMYKEGIIN